MTNEEKWEDEWELWSTDVWKPTPREAFLEGRQRDRKEVDHLNLMLQTEREESERWMKKEEVLQSRVRELESLLSQQGGKAVPPSTLGDWREWE